MKLREIAHLLQGELVGDGEIDIVAPMDIERAGTGHITYLNLPIKKGVSCNASAVIVNKRLDIPNAQILVDNPKAAFAIALGVFYPKRHPYTGVSQRADIGEEVLLGEGVTIGPFAVIGRGSQIGARTVIYPGVYIGSNVKIGEDCILYSNVNVMDDCVIGNRVVLHAGAVIGADGFGFVFDKGRHLKIPQVGNVEIQEDVEVGANTTIDRATLGTTTIGKGTKIDNLVQIGHNVSIGANSIIVAQAGIGGSSKIGQSVIIAGQAGVSDHCEIESGSVIGAQAGVTGRLQKNIYVGTPGKPYKKVIKAYDLFPILPELKHRIEKLEGLVSDGVPSEDIKDS